jgi:hypothetical protein
MKQRIYLDTSVIGGYYDDEFSADTALFFDIIISDLLEAELLRAPDFVKELLSSLNNSSKEKVKLTPEANELADKYINAKVVGQTSRADCQHNAIATICNADVLVSWNFKHIVNLDRIRGYNGIKLQSGYKMIEIRTPKEIIKYGTQE